MWEGSKWPKWGHFFDPKSGQKGVQRGLWETPEMCTFLAKKGSKRGQKRGSKSGQKRPILGSKITLFSGTPEPGHPQCYSIEDLEGVWKLPKIGVYFHDHFRCTGSKRLISGFNFGHFQVPEGVSKRGQIPLLFCGYFERFWPDPERSKMGPKWGQNRPLGGVKKGSKMGSKRGHFTL